MTHTNKLSQICLFLLVNDMLANQLANLTTGLPLFGPK